MRDELNKQSAPLKYLYLSCDVPYLLLYILHIVISHYSCAVQVHEVKVVIILPPRAAIVHSVALHWQNVLLSIYQ